jgi:coproporphyrinogen III oxidase
MEIKTRTISSSEKASEALGLVESLQSRFVQALEKLGHVDFEGTEWLRDDGIHGGGIRYGISDSTLLGRASVNVSQIHYDDDANRKLGSATAISTIVHPAHPRAPSVHIHISWTELKNGSGYWRIMADLNPALINALESDCFLEKLKHATPYEFDSAVEQGERYFFIPALGRHRGSAHFYLEHYNSGEFKRDLALAHQVGLAAIDGYIELLNSIISDLSIPSDDELAAQVAYHTLYLFQVLTLDRGTTSGLLVHDQNDIGILGSLPPKVDKNLLASWRSRMPQPQEKLLDGILAALPRKGLCIIDDGVKRTLANAVRSHYQTYPEALDLQASGNTIPPTISNHQ